MAKVKIKFKVIDHYILRLVRLSICNLCTLGGRTLSRSIAFAGLYHTNWSADYRLLKLWHK